MKFEEVLWALFLDNIYSKPYLKNCIVFKNLDIFFGLQYIPDLDLLLLILGLTFFSYILELLHRSKNFVVKHLQNISHI